MSLRSFLQAVWLLLCGTPVFAQTNDHTFACTADTYTSLVNLNTTYGSSTSLSVKATGSSNQERAFVNFSFVNASFPSGIPFNARILSATLTMKGTVTGGTPSLRAERVLNMWDNSLTHVIANSFSYGLDVVPSANPLTGQYTFDVTAHVQAMVAGAAPSNGWRIRHNNEAVTTPVCNFSSRDATTSPTPPTLRIQWYVPLTVTNAVVTQASDTSQFNGSIVPQISYGIGNRRYQWIRGNAQATVIDTTSSLVDVPSDWYGLRVTDETTDTLYMAFLVGVKCGSSHIRFNPDRNYVSDAVLTMQNDGTGDYSNVNYGLINNFQGARWQTSGGFYNMKSVMRFHLWMDPLNLLDTARLHLSGRGHTTTTLNPNAAQLNKITTPWREYTITYAHAAVTAASPAVLIPAKTGTQGTDASILAFWNDWKIDNPANFGFMLRLQDTTPSVKLNHHYYSADNTDPLVRPYIQFTVHGTCNRPSLPQISYSELKREPDAGYAHTAEGKLKFYFTEEYKIASGKYLPMRIYNQSHQLMGSVDINGVQTSGLNTLSYTFADNRYILNLTNLSLQNGQIYLLEVETSTEEKRYLKFIYRN